MASQMNGTCDVGIADTRVPLPDASVEADPGEWARTDREASRTMQ
jgi:hypothetical protein